MVGNETLVNFTKAIQIKYHHSIKNLRDEQNIKVLSYSCLNKVLEYWSENVLHK